MQQTVKVEKKMKFGILRRRWENNIKMNLRAIACIGVNRIHLVECWFQVPGFCDHTNETSLLFYKMLNLMKS
jgi:hypothetical protein